MRHRDECPQCMALWLMEGGGMSFWKRLWDWLVNKEQEFQVKPTPKRKAKRKGKR